MFNINNLDQSFSRKRILREISCQFPNSGVSIIIGTNGCGKSTFMNVLSEMIPFSSGEIICNGFPIKSKEYNEQIFYIPSDFYLPEFMTGEEYINFILKHYKNADFLLVEFLLNLFDLAEYKNTLIEKYSFGMKKKIQVIASFCSFTPYILADEIFSGLDFDTVILLESLIDYFKEKRSFIIVSHDMDTLKRFPENIFIMNKGCITPFLGNVNDKNDIVKSIGGISDKINSLHEYFGNSKTIY